MANITIREYHPESGALLGNITTLKFGRVASGTHTRVKVIDVAFDGVSSVGNIKIGLVSNAGITVNADPQEIDSKGSSSNGNFGIEDTTTFDAAKASAPLSRYFAGLNGTATVGNDNNVTVGIRATAVSNYIYLDVKVGSTLSGAGNGAYKIFFDYS
jgi:hypothetical protein